MRKAFWRLTVFLFLTVAFFVGAYSLDSVTLGFSRLLPENYKYLADRAYSREDFKEVARICRKRIEQFSYDFDARMFLADALMADGNPKEAAMALRDAISRIPGIRGSKAKVTGFDEGRLYLYLATSLWDGGQYFTAGEMTRAAMDAGSAWVRRDMYPRLLKSSGKMSATEAAIQVALKVGARDFFCTTTAQLDQSSSEGLISSVVAEARWREMVDHDTTTSAALLDWAVQSDQGNVRARLANAGFLIRSGKVASSERLLAQLESTTGAKSISPGQFNLPSGGSQTPNGINLSRNGTATVRVQTGVYRVTTLAFFASGTSALGSYPILIVKSGDDELTRLYIDSSKPRLYCLDLWPTGAPKTLDLKFEFINDIYDPYTKSDRNVTLSHIVLL